MARLTKFLRDREYVGLNWIRDIGWRLTGAISVEGLNLGGHPVSRIYYSPETMDYLCECRNGPGICFGGANPGMACTVDNNTTVPNKQCPEGNCLPQCGTCVGGAANGTSCGADEQCPDGHCGRVCAIGGSSCTADADCGANGPCVLIQTGAMIIKEMHSITSLSFDKACSESSDIACSLDSDCLAGETCEDLMWIDDACYADDPAFSAIMVRGVDGGHDGWFWVSINATGSGDPPILGRSAVQDADFFDLQLLTEHSNTRYPTGQAANNPGLCDTSFTPCSTAFDCPAGEKCVTTRKLGSIVPANYEFGLGTLECVNCHASAVTLSTFSDLRNILGNEMRYTYKVRDAADPPCENDGFHGSDVSSLLFGYPRPLSAPDPEFLSLFTQFSADTPSIQNVLDSRFPADTYDHVVSSHAFPSFQNQEQFVTSDQCSSCHNAAARNPTEPNMTVCKRVPCSTQQNCLTSGCGEAATCSNGQCMVPGKDGNPPQPCQQQINLSPYAEWQASPMGMAGRDPIFFSLLETETNLSPMMKDCLTTFCMNCHGVMGRRQIGIDDPAGTPQCANILDPEFGPASFPQLFPRDLLTDWPGKNPGDIATLKGAKYGGLARDGVSCAACHHIDNVSSPLAANQLTGNFDVGPADVIFGPYDDNVTEIPMKNSLGMTPIGAPQIQQPGVCGTCHVIRVPVLDPLINGTIPLACLDKTQQGNPTVGPGIAAIAACAPPAAADDPCSVVGFGTGTCQLYFTFEQTTYLEFLNSVFSETANQPDTFRSCQDCHMPRTFNGKNLAFKIANVQDDDMSPAQNAVPISLQTRQRFPRHLLYGLNVFINEMFQQFPLILGRRQIDYQNSSAKPPLLTARDAVVKQAREITANIAVSPPTLEPGPLDTFTLKADVTVTNKTGHKLSTGVGFRRLWIEFLVCDTAPGEDCTCDNALWASGCTNSLGVILNGKHGPVLASEFACPNEGGVASPSPACPPAPIDLSQGCPAQQGPEEECYQPHFQTIRNEYEVQIYTEKVADCSGKLTGSVTHLCEEVKDNRLLPTGWRSDGPYAGVTDPGPIAMLDPEYPMDGTPASGSDIVSYEIALTDMQAQDFTSVRATLYFQAIPPSFLNERFNSALVGAAEKTDTERLYFITSRLNVDVEDDASEKFIKDWKLEIGHAQIGPSENEACCFSDNTCQMLDPLCCIDKGGTPQGPGSTCGGTEACCDSDTGACYTADRTCCLANGDTPQGPGTACSAPEACCFSDNTCQMFDPLCCANQGGTPEGPGSTCGGVEACCDSVTGACYTADRTCCLANGDTPNGPGSVCTAPAACCLSGTCEVLDPFCCIIRGGVPQAPGTTCGECGSCCLADKDCLDDIVNGTCAAIGGSFNGAGSICLGDSDGDGIDSQCDNCIGVDDAIFGTFICDSGLVCETDADCAPGETCKKACLDRIPAVSEWGLVVLMLALLVLGKLYYGRRATRG